MPRRSGLVRKLACVLPLASAVLAAGGAQARSEADERAARCLAMVAYAEAAGEGREGMAAVMEVVRNRVADPRFPDHACAVVAQKRQFQPVSEKAALRRAVQDPAAHDMARVLDADAPIERRALEDARRLAAEVEKERRKDRTGGALYFVNPRLMDPAYCAWFANLKRTAVIGGHVFLTHYAKGERRAGPAIDCEAAGKGFWVYLPKRYAIGLFDPKGPRVATRTPTRKMLEAWRRSGKLEARQAELKKHFKPGWYLAEAE